MKARVMLGVSGESVCIYRPGFDPVVLTIEEALDASEQLERLAKVAARNVLGTTELREMEPA